METSYVKEHTCTRTTSVVVTACRIALDFGSSNDLRLAVVDTRHTCCSRPPVDDTKCRQVRGMILHDTWMTNMLLRKI